jgi:serine/threonine-protein kinase
MSDQISRLNAALAGRYAIDRELGQGGMATVYLADDLKHERKVALKVLKPELAAVVGAERFLVEIKTTANLQHPHILPLHDSGEADGFLFYVMPYIEGESLRDRLNREHQLPVDEAVRLATDIAEALHAAHQKGVIHRDIKPANILLSGGRPLVADFGIALAVTAAGGGRMTETGLSLGTPHYMSPEQATGDQSIGPGSDIYGLGCVLYEMLVGDPPHTASTPQAVLGRIITGSPDPVREHRKAVPMNVEAAIHRALEKVPADRFASAASFAAALADPGFRYGAGFDGPDATSSSALRRWRATAGLMTAASVLALVFALTRGTPETQPALDVSISLPSEAPLSFQGRTPLGIWQKGLDISPDGQTVVYVAAVDGRTQLRVRRMDHPDIVPLEGTEDAFHPFFSPDGEWIGFFVGEELRKVRVTGGTPIPIITNLENPVGADWWSDGRILVANLEGAEWIWVPESAGSPESAHVLGSDRASFPHILPDGESALGTALFTGKLVVVSLDGASFVTLEPAGSQGGTDAGAGIVGYSPIYSPSGHILYLSVTSGVLMALPFDPSSRTVLGPAIPVRSDVRREVAWGFGHVGLAENGTLVYAPGRTAEAGYLAFADGESIDTLPFAPANYESLRLSPGGSTIAAIRRNEVGLRTAILMDIESGRVTPIEEPATAVVSWTADGGNLILNDDSLTISYSPEGQPSENWGAPMGWGDFSSPSGVSAAGTQWVTADGRRDSLGFTAYQPAMSASGEWLAYFELGGIWVSPVPPGSQRPTLIVSGRGEQPQWAPGDDRLIYRDGTRFWSVDVSTEDGFQVSPPTLFAEGPFSRVWNRSYDVAPDGRLLVVVGPPEQSVDQINVVTSFVQELGGG